MAVVSVLVGGIFGFASFLLSWFAFGASFLGALAVYAVVGTGISAIMLVVGAMQQSRAADAAARRELEAAIRSWEEDAAADKQTADHLRARQAEEDTGSQVA
ncbi:hypothetical protein R5H30_10615 [Sulfitobacter sp. D35]|uniref:hypothetical protein n=1 Tax=Sulfitobacter sp. D35 TaxID=3083252 RepID=UPI00296E6516|nr:hypothetical protein [Sulfitobacter sp. D35]MDW4498434.1 hypothetical protein [Sulfitobacter sp. D35]